jgi:oligopeptide transport system ATP-binding protein
MEELKKKMKMSIIMITHDLGVVAKMCDEVIVMYAGSICEAGTVEEIFYNPSHEYTKGLLRSVPSPQSIKHKLCPIPGSPPNLLDLNEGCPFYPRCDKAMNICTKKRADRININENHIASCWMNQKKIFELNVNCKADGGV